MPPCVGCVCARVLCVCYHVECACVRVCVCFEVRSVSKFGEPKNTQRVPAETNGVV
jgi:hypothetical protein